MKNITIFAICFGLIGFQSNAEPKSAEFCTNIAQLAETVAIARKNGASRDELRYRLAKLPDLNAEGKVLTSDLITLVYDNDLSPEQAYADLFLGCLVYDK